MSFLDGFKVFFETSEDANATSTSCSSDIDHYKFYQFSLIPSVLITLVLSATTRRTEKILNVFDGRPGLLIPMDALTRSSRLSYCAAFGSTAMLVYKILLEQRFAIDYDGPIALKTLIAILSMIIYGTVYFPIFSCLALGTAISYGLGTLFIWTFTVIDFYYVVECDLTDTGRLMVIIRQLPSLLCHSYLSISLPVRFVRSLMNGVYLNPVEDSDVVTIHDVRNSYQGKHVRERLKKPPIISPPEGFLNNLKAAIMGFLHNWIYHVETGFRYPSRLLSVMMTAGIVVYVITVEFLVFFVSLLDAILTILSDQLDVVEWESQSWDTPEISDYRDGLLVAHYIANLVRTCLIVSVVLTALCSFLTILHMLSNYRTNLNAMYRGDYKLIPSPAEKSAASLCVGSIKYAGYQVAYIVWSYIVVLLIIFLVSIILATVITLIIEGYTDWLVNNILQIWPGLVVTMVVLVVQIMLAKKVFLQEGGEYLRLNNRRFFFIFTYFMFFYNIFLGLVSCLLRIVKAIGVGVIFLSRLDNSTLPRKFEFFDPGFSAYQGFIHMEAAHTHPIVIVFIQLLQAMKHEHQGRSENVLTNGDTADIENGNTGTHWRRLSNIESVSGSGSDLDDQKKEANRKATAARFQWWVTYTLLQNPQVRIYRKGYVQALRKARKEGIRIPLSDLPVSEFDLVKMQMEKEEERQKLAEEAKKKKSKEKTGVSYIELEFVAGDSKKVDAATSEEHHTTLDNHHV